MPDAASGLLMLSFTTRGCRASGRLTIVSRMSIVTVESIRNAGLSFEFPARRVLAQTPTPIHHLPHLSRHLGTQLYCKRDDLSGFGGNETRKDHVVGASMALVQDGRIAARRDYGFADLAAGRRVDADTTFHWASISKTLNAISIMQLRDHGQLSLQDSLSGYLPELRQVQPCGSMDQITFFSNGPHSKKCGSPDRPCRTVPKTIWGSASSSRAAVRTVRVTAMPAPAQRWPAGSSGFRRTCRSHIRCCQSSARSHMR